MSHFVTINTQIKDLDALRSALKELGLSLFPQAQARGYEDNKIKGDFVIRLNVPYDIAFNQQPDGTYGLSCDWFLGHVEKEVGKNYSKLLQLYATHKAIREARKKGYSVMRKNQADGAIKLTLVAV
jgi:Protein of unknown function (DUF1257)